MIIVTEKSGISMLPELPECVDKAVDNIINPIATNAGKTLGDLWVLVFGGIYQAAEKKKLKIAANLEQFKIELQSGVNAIPNERKVEPKLQVVCPAMEHSKYCIEEATLRAMFVNLISKSMDSSCVDKVHPSFSWMISQMSPVDAIVLKRISLASNYLRGIPIIKFKFQAFPRNYSVIYVNSELSENTEFTAYEKSRAIDSLVRLGIIDLEFQSAIAEAVYSGLDLPDFKNTPEILHYKNILISSPREISLKLNDKIVNVDVERGNLYFTEIGKAFASICI